LPKFSISKKISKYPTLGKAKRESSVYTPIGTTDSEAAFCAMLNALKAEFDEPPALPLLYEAVQRLCCEIIRGDEDKAIFNFLLGCGRHTLFAFSWPGARPGSKVWNGLSYTIRQPPFTNATLCDLDYTVDFSKVATNHDRVAVITTVPLTTDEKWVTMKKGELLMFDQGLPFSNSCACEEVERYGRGLKSTLQDISQEKPPSPGAVSQ